MSDLLRWYLTLTAFQLATVPLAWSWFRFLPDRGWGVARPLGLLVGGFLVWSLGHLGLLTLGAGSGLVILVALPAAGFWLAARAGEGPADLLRWLRGNRRLLGQEILFLGLLLFWLWYRTHDTFGIAHTEQPMDFALMNALLRGGELPPNDPWLSGFAISYYYMGYLIMAQLTALSGVPAGVAYNLGLMTLAAMVGQGAFSLTFALLQGIWAEGRRALLAATALLAPLFILGISNLTGLLSVLYYRGYGADALFNRLGVNGLTVENGVREPQAGWWWWNASRTVSDFDAAGNRLEVIDEFPFFSFLLGDMHPHVLALPFALVGIAIALNGVRALADPGPRPEGAHFPPEAASRPALTRPLFLLSAVVVGGMAMLNTWDFPTSLAVVAGGWLLAVPALSGAARETGLRRWAARAALLAAAALLLYLPFYLGFRSQAEGIRLSPYRTAVGQYLLMFGFFWMLLLPLVLTQLSRIAAALRTVGGRTAALIGLMLVADGLVLLFLSRLALADGVLALLAAAFWALIPLAALSLRPDGEPTPLFVAQLAGVPLLLGLLTAAWTLALTAALLALLLLALWALVGELFPGTAATRLPRAAVDARSPLVAGGSEAATVADIAPRPPLSGLMLLFTLALAALAILLTMGAELFFIKDGFGGRMNTVFKLYYQAWLLLALASPPALLYMARRLPAPARLTLLAATGLLTAALLWYPVEALRSKADFSAPARWDGRFWMATADPDRYAAIEWLEQLPEQVVVVEMPGGSYRAGESALAGWTGHSTLLGWTGHELQWRGSVDEIARREPIIQEIYTNPDPDLTRLLLEQWQVDYVAVTPAEVARYNLTPAQIDKFYQFMTPVFEQGEVRLFGR